MEELIFIALFSLILSGGTPNIAPTEVQLVEPLPDQWRRLGLKVTSKNDAAILRGRWKAWEEKQLPDGAHMDFTIYDSTETLINESFVDLKLRRVIEVTRRRATPAIAEFSVILDADITSDTTVYIAYHQEAFTADSHINLALR